MGKNSLKFHRAYTTLHEKYPDTKFRFPIKRCFSSEAILHLDKILVQDSRFPVWQTSTPIQFDQFSLRTTEKEVRRTKGRPTCLHWERIGPFWINILGYYTRIEQIPVRIIYFFHNGHLCFGEYICNRSSPDVCQTLRKALTSPYFSDEIPTQEAFYVNDQSGTRILFYNNGITTSMKFIDPSCQEAKNMELLNLFSKEPMILPHIE